MAVIIARATGDGFCPRAERTANMVISRRKGACTAEISGSRRQAFRGVLYLHVLLIGMQWAVRGCERGCYDYIQSGSRQRLATSNWGASLGRPLPLNAGVLPAADRFVFRILRW